MQTDKSIVWARDDLVNYVNSNTVQFIARCETKWHLLAINAFLNYTLKESDEVYNGIIYICPRDGVYCISAEDIIFPDRIQYIAVFGKDISTGDKIKQSLKTLVRSSYSWGNNKKTIFVISPESAWSLVINKIDPSIYFPKPIIIEDGFAHYNSESIWIKESNTLYRKIITLLQFRMIHCLEKKMNLAPIYFTLFDKYNGMSCNDEIVEAFKDCLSQNNTTSDATEISAPDILFLTQPFVDDGHVSEEQMSIFYKNLVDFFGMSIKFKVHPRDKSIETMNFLKPYLLLDSGKSVEELYRCFKDKPQYVLGFNSTSLISLNLFYGANAISVIDIITPNLKSEYLRNSFLNFRTLFSKHIRFIETYNELDTH